MVIVGSGNVAEALARAAVENGIGVEQVFARNPERGRAVAAIARAPWCGKREDLAQSDLYIIAVSDRAVAEVAEQLPFAEGATVAHTAGAVGIDALPASIAHRAVFYPFMTFTAGRKVDWRTVPLLIEASDAPTRERLHRFARRISDRVADADAEQRVRVHLAGVFANNFANAMFAAAVGQLREAGLPSDLTDAIILETARKAVASHDPAAVQTGPAVRGDAATQERHRRLLAGDELLTRIYNEISEYIWQQKISKR